MSAEKMRIKAEKKTNCTDTKWVSKAFLRLKNVERAFVARRVWTKNPKHIATNTKQNNKVAISHKVMVNKDRIKGMDQ